MSASENEASDAAEGAPEGLWLSLSDLARERGVSKQSIWKRVERFKLEGKVTLRKGQRGVVLVNVAEFDRATGESTDLARATQHAPTRCAPSAAPTQEGLVYTREQARRASYDAELKRLDLAARMGKLIPADEVEAAGDLIGQTFADAADRLPIYADDIAAAVAAGGVAGARCKLKEIGLNLRREVAQAMEVLLTMRPPPEASASAARAEDAGRPDA
jgi:biotin operon repressor